MPSPLGTMKWVACGNSELKHKVQFHGMFEPSLFVPRRCMHAMQ